VDAPASKHQIMKTKAEAPKIKKGDIDLISNPKGKDSCGGIPLIACRKPPTSATS
jgi:hypothetical protein